MLNTVTALPSLIRFVIDAADARITAPAEAGVRVVFANSEVVELHGIGQGNGLAQIAHGVGRRSEGAAIRILLDVREAENT